MTPDRPYKYLFTLLYLTLGFGAVVAGFFIAGENTAGWDGLNYILYGMGVAALWALVSVVYLLWVTVRGGWRQSKIPALIIIAIIAAGTAFLTMVDY